MRKGHIRTCRGYVGVGGFYGDIRLAKESLKVGYQSLSWSSTSASMPQSPHIGGSSSLEMSQLRLKP